MKLELYSENFSLFHIIYISIKCHFLYQFFLKLETVFRAKQCHPCPPVVLQ